MDDVNGVSFPRAQDTGQAPELADVPFAPAAGEGDQDGLDDVDFAVVLLQALTRMAARSKRRQADLVAALRGADIVADPARIRSALKILRAYGAIENLVPLSDGGLLLSVTHKGSDRASPPPQWLPLEELDVTAA
jgi:hypothetical protein